MFVNVFDVDEYIYYEWMHIITSTIHNPVEDKKTYVEHYNIHTK